MDRVLRNKKALLLFVLPAALLFSFLVVVPVIWSVGYTFYDGMPGVDFKFTGLDNFKMAFADKKLWGYAATNLKYVLIVVTGQVLFGLGAALMIVFCVKKYKNFIRVAIFIPVILPSVAVAQLFSKIYEIVPQYGLLNSLLDLAGLQPLIHAWIGETSTALGSICAMDIWKGIGLYCLIFYSALLDVPDDVVEAAKIDGANKFRLIMKIYVPLIRPIMKVCLIFSLTGTFKVYDSIIALTKGGPGTTTYVPSIYMYSTAFNYNKYGYGSVIALIILLECLVATGIVRKIFTKDNTV